MKKSFLIVGAIALFVTLGIIVACNKENSQAGLDDNYPALKGTPYDTSQLRTLLEVVWHHCDSAYHADSSYFLYRCSQNDTAGFLQMTHIPPKVIVDIAYEANLMYQDFFASSPSISFDTTPCLSCILEALPAIGTAMVNHYDIINQIKTYEPSFVDTVLCLENPSVNSCDYKCLPALINHSFVRYMCCLFKCALQHHIDINTAYLVKLSGGTYIPPQQ
ncbi:MAG: hypothetical protein IJR04_02685 [Bacteroidales bacterium]|nr:hypothetical protein [Bacteroidales bacterium]